MLKFGDYVRVKHNCYKYSGSLQGLIGQVANIYGKHSKIGVQLLDRPHPTNKNGLYWLDPNDIEVVNPLYEARKYVEEQQNNKEEKKNMISDTEKQAFILMLESWCRNKGYHLNNIRNYRDSKEAFRFEIHSDNTKEYLVMLNQMRNIFESFDALTKDFEEFNGSNYVDSTKQFFYDNKPIYCAPNYPNTPSIRNVYFNYPYVIVLWSDKTKTVVKCGEDDFYDPEKGLAMAISKKFLGTNKNKSNYYDVFKKWLGEYEEKNKPYESLLGTIFNSFRDNFTFRDLNKEESSDV